MMKKKGNTRDLLGEEEKRRESYIASNVGLAGIISMEKWKAPPRGCNQFSLSVSLCLSPFNLWDSLVSIHAVSDRRICFLSRASRRIDDAR